MFKRDKWHFLTTQVGYDKFIVPIFEASAGNKCILLLKTLMSSCCTNNCKFCAFRDNSAPYTDLIKIPGIGPLTAKKIIDFRSSKKISDVNDLRLIGITKKAMPFYRDW